MLKILQTGIYTSIQDMGRAGCRKYGVPLSGVMDTYSASRANLILNNLPNCAVLECTQNGPKLLFTKTTQIAVCGADMQVKLNEKPVDLNKPFFVQANDVLQFGKLQYGLRAYIAVKHGFISPLVLNSRSYYQPLTIQQTVVKNQTIEYETFNESVKTSNGVLAVNKDHYKAPFLNVHPGPEFGMLNKKQRTTVFDKAFHVGINNRMAYQLQEPLINNLAQILTSAVLPGTVQLTPSGKLIVLMRDAQTTGGYPRILQLTEQAINCLTQKRLNDEVFFRIVF